MNKLELKRLRFLLEKLEAESLEELKVYEKMSKDETYSYENTGVRNIKEYCPDYALLIALRIIEGTVNSMLDEDDLI